MKRIVYVTGSRAEYGRMRLTLREIQASPNLKLSLIVVGMHLSEEFGYTIDEVEKDGFKIDAAIETIQHSDSGIGMAKAFSASVSVIASALKRRKYDMLLIIGDRSDMLAAAIAGAHMNIPITHIGGGYISGSIDDRIRHAITIFSDVHFTANKKTAKKVLDLGANPSNVYIVGAPDLDAILSKEFASSSEVFNKFNLDPTKPVLLVSQHPVTTEFEDVAEQMRETMEALTTIGAQAVVTYPNADAGGRRMIHVINKYKRFPYIHVYRNISYFLYLGLMCISDVLVGNSSAGVIEAPSFGLPVVNIGTRQKGREKAENVIEVGYNQKEIIEAIRKALSPEFKNIARYSKNPYGDGKTGCRIAKILEEIN